MRVFWNSAIQWAKTKGSDYVSDLILFLGVIAIGIIGFEVGFSEGQSRQSAPLVIEVPVKTQTSVEGISGAKTTPALLDTAINQTEIKADASKCAFTGSKNSNKYHLPTCAIVKRIKSENRVCFSSEEDAHAKGYTAGCVK